MQTKKRANACCSPGTRFSPLSAAPIRKDTIDIALSGKGWTPEGYPLVSNRKIDNIQHERSSDQTVGKLIEPDKINGIRKHLGATFGLAGWDGRLDWDGLMILRLVNRDHREQPVKRLPRNRMFWCGG